MNINLLIISKKQYDMQINLVFYSKFTLTIISLCLNALLVPHDVMLRLRSLFL